MHIVTLFWEKVIGQSVYLHLTVQLKSNNSTMTNTWMVLSSSATVPALATDPTCLMPFQAIGSTHRYVFTSVYQEHCPNCPHLQHGEVPTQIGRRGDAQQIHLDIASQPGQVLLRSQRDHSWLARWGSSTAKRWSFQPTFNPSGAQGHAGWAGVQRSAGQPELQLYWFLILANCAQCLNNWAWQCYWVWRSPSIANFWSCVLSVLIS